MDINTVEIKIKRVKLLGFSVDETLYRGVSEDDKLNLEFQFFITIDVPKNELSLTLRAYYIYADAPPISTLVDFHVVNTFFIKDFANHVVLKADGNENDINLNDNAWSIIAGLSVSHTRGFMSNSLADTMYKEFIIPIVNPLEFARRLLNLKIPETEKAST